MKILKKYLLLARRMRVAYELGFAFRGTSYTKLPDRLCLFDQVVSVHYPDDPGFIGDVIGIFLDDDYGLETVCRPIETIIDVGANVGLFSLWARHKFRSAVIHAYEPNDQILSYTSANLKKANVTLFREGVSNANAAGELVLGASSRGAKTRKNPVGGVKLTGIDVAIDRIGGRLDFLKIDCEGGEWDILLNNAALQKVRQIRRKYHLGEEHQLSELWICPEA